MVFKQRGGGRSVGNLMSGIVYGSRAGTVARSGGSGVHADARQRHAKWVGVISLGIL